MSDVRHYDHAVLENARVDALSSAVALEELAAYCQTRKLKPTVYTGKEAVSLPNRAASHRVNPGVQQQQQQQDEHIMLRFS